MSTPNIPSDIAALWLPSHTQDPSDDRNHTSSVHWCGLKDSA